MTSNGILVVDKPTDVTSHDVVDAVRRIFGMRKVGHTGTLDPLATGVLVLILGRATRLAQYLQVDPKEYVGEMVLGIATDSYDATGEVLEEHTCKASEDDVRDVFSQYVGTFDQIPPMRSAVKIDGVPLYKLAR